MHKNNKSNSVIDVPKEYEIAIETALGGSIQNIVTDSEQTAKVLIEHLKKNRFGRATFLPLSAISAGNGFNTPGALKEPGAIGIAADLVHVRPEYQTLARYLLGRVLVVDHIDNAIAIARKYRHSIRIVTPEGDLLNPGGSMSGGAFKNSSNLLGRKREMEELEEACKKALTTVDKIQAETIFQEGIFQEKSGELENVKSDLQKKYLEENTAKIALKQLEGKKEELYESSADMNLENRQLEEQIHELRDSLAAIAGEMKRLEIATVLAKPHKVSIFDEPEAGIDLWSFSMLIKRFEEIHKEKKECLILISHQERIIQMADKIMVIEDGQVKEYGTKEDVLPTLFQQKTGRMCGQEGGTC